MEQVFSYIISLGASVMMPILFTIIGLCIGMKFGKALKSGLYVGVGFVGLGIVTALLTNNFGNPLSEISRLYDLQLGVFDMGWPAAAAVAYNTAVGALIIPICLGVNFLLLITKCTRTVNIDLWNYWHFAFIGAVAYFVMDQSLIWGYFAAIVCYVITLVMADLSADKFQQYYDDMDGISIPQPFCQSFTAFAIGINWLLDRIPGFSKLDIDADGLKKKFGVLGEPIVLGVIVGALIGAVAQMDIKKVLFLGVTMGAVMELIPRITKLFIDGLKPIAEKTQEVVHPGGGTEEVGWKEGVYRYVACPRDRSSHDAGGFADTYSAGAAGGCGPAWQRVPAPGIARRYVLCICDGSALHER